MVNPNRFYTYAYLREDKTPYYVGKGSGYRIISKNRKGIYVPKDKSRVIFLKQNLTEEEAFKHEIYMIAVFGRKDLGTGILHNRTNGGEGVSGPKTEEHRRKIKEANKNPSQEIRKKIGDANRGRIQTKETRDKISKALTGKIISEETKKKLSLANIGEKNYFYGKNMSGERNGFYGKSVTPENKEKLSKKHCRLFEFTKPDGEKIIIKTNLKKFCSENNLNRNSMSKILNNKPHFKSHKGWTVKLVS
jgi:hypothetical protein